MRGDIYHDIAEALYASTRNLKDGIDWSDEALQVMALDDRDPRIEHLRLQLRRLRREIEARFPAARALVRPGFDEPVTPAVVRD